MIGCFRISCSLAPSPRAVRSVALPAAKGTMILIGLSGNACAKAFGAAVSAATPASAERRFNFTKRSSLGLGGRPVVARAGSARKGGRLNEELFRLAVGVQAGHELAVAVVEQGGDALLAAQRLFGRLAPARMRHLRVHVGPEAVFARLQLLPERNRPLVAELDADDRLHVLEAVLPRR